MKSINFKRWLLGGLAAGLTLFLLTGAINAGLLQNEFQSWSREMGTLIHPPAQSTSMILWTLMSFIYGFVGAAIYVGFRPRFGAGLKTAVLAGCTLWILSKLTTALDLVALGILPLNIIMWQLASSFVTMMIAVVIASWLYQEA